MDYRVFYANTKLLNKYNKRIPKTWDELIETGRYIYDEEFKDIEDSEYFIYNGSLDGIIITNIFTAINTIYKKNL